MEKSNTSFKCEELVWAKIRGHPFWPAVVSYLYNITID